MGLRRAAIVTMGLLGACGPSLDPWWLVTAPRELALDMQVVQQGPYGERIVPRPQTPRDALPLDTLAMEPVIVDGDGPIDLATLEAVWFSCASTGACFGSGPLQDRPACDDEALRRGEPCRFADQARGELTLPDFPDDLADDPSTALDLALGGAVALVASAPDGPGLDQCLARFDDRQRLDGCLLMERPLLLGPFGELVPLLEERGVDAGIGPEADTLLLRPRNRNPKVQEILVEQGGRSISAADGDRIELDPDREIELTIITTADDEDAYEVQSGEATLTVGDDLVSQWWFDREIDLVDTPIGGLSVRWHPHGQPGVRAYVVLRDNRGGEDVGWLDFDFQGQASAGTRG